MEEIRESTRNELIELLIRYPSHGMIEHVEAQDFTDALSEGDQETKRAIYHLLGKLGEPPPHNHSAPEPGSPLAK